MMGNILKLLAIFYISNVFEVSLRRHRSFWLDLAAAISHPKLCVLVQYPG